MKHFDVDLTPEEKEMLAEDLMKVCRDHGLASGPVKQLGHMVEHRLHVYRRVAVLSYIRGRRRSATLVERRRDSGSRSRSTSSVPSPGTSFWPFRSERPVTCG